MVSSLLEDPDAPTAGTGVRVPAAGGALGAPAPAGPAAPGRARPGGRGAAASRHRAVHHRPEPRRHDEPGPAHARGRGALRGGARRGGHRVRARPGGGARAQPVDRERSARRGRAQPAGGRAAGAAAAGGRRGGDGAGRGGHPRAEPLARRARHAGAGRGQGRADRVRDDRRRRRAAVRGARRRPAGPARARGGGGGVARHRDVARGARAGGGPAAVRRARQRGGRLAHRGRPRSFPKELVDAGAAGRTSGSGRDAAGQVLGAYAPVPGTGGSSGRGWFVLSRQPAAVAESVARDVRRQLFLAVAAALCLAIAISALAWRFLVRPLREMARAQRRLAGFSSGAIRPGTEIGDLRDALSMLERQIKDREAIGAVFVGRYQVVSFVGAGAMGSVFRGWDPKLQRPVALKTIRLDAEEKASARERVAAAARGRDRRALLASQHRGRVRRGGRAARRLHRARVRGRHQPAALPALARAHPAAGDDDGPRHRARPGRGPRARRSCTAT